MKRINIFWISGIIVCIIIVVTCLFYICKHQVYSTINKLYNEIYESDERVFELCRKAHSKGMDAEYTLSEIIAIEYVCKCVVEKTKKYSQMLLSH